MSWKSFFKWTCIICSITTITLYFYKDQLPEPKTYEYVPLTPPLQTPTSRAPFEIDTNNERYYIDPKFDYDLYGVIVSYNNANGFTDIWHYDVWKDFINIRDLCVIWNPNVSSGVYKQITFTHDTWTCWAYWENDNLNNVFKNTALSNNHLLTNNNEIKSKLMSAEVGDVVHFKGSLVSYKNLNNGGWRGTSIKRDDTGNGACETVYLDDFQIIKKANPVLRNFYFLSKWAAIISGIIYLIMYFRAPFRSSL